MKLKVITGIMLTLLLIGMLTSAFNIHHGTSCSKPEGSVDPSQIGISSGTLFIRYVNFDDVSSEPQYDFDETIEVTVEVDTTEAWQDVDLGVVLYDPDENQWDWDYFPEYRTYNGEDDPKTLNVSTYGNLDRWLGYAGGDRKWRAKVTVADADTHLIEDTEYKYFWGGPRPIRHFTCKDCSNPDGTRTTTFYDIDEKACEYTEWDTHGLYITYDVRFKFYGPMGLYKTSDIVDLTPGLSSTSASGSIDIKLNPPGFNPGSWYVEYYFESRYRNRDDFTIEYTGELKYINVPFHYQEEKYYCGPAALEMVFDFYGEDVPQLEIADVARTDPRNGDPSYNGTFTDDMRRAGHFSNLSTSVGNEMPGSITGYSVRKLGYASFKKAPMTIDDLKSLIDIGYPIIVLMNYSSSSSSGHYRVIVGYDNYNDEIILHDPWNKPAWGDIYGGANITMNYTLFLDLWEYSNYWGLFVSPWETVLTSSAMSENTSRISANVKYVCPPPFDDSQYPASSCNATIFLPVGVNLTEGETWKKTIGEINAGSSTTVNWTAQVDNHGYYDLSVEVEGRISGYVGAHGSYPSYNYKDRIGEVHQETVHLGAIRVPDEYSTIQEAINHANEGDMILVSAGTYYENVVVNKSVTLTGDSQASIIDGGAIGTVVHVTVGNANISDFTIRNSNHYGIFVESAEGCIILRNNVTNNSIGIRIWFSKYCAISENVVTNNREHGISLDNSADSVLIGNTVNKNAEIGIVLSYSDNCTISDNYVQNNNDSGILIDYSRNSTVIGNSVISNVCYGIILRVSSNSLVSRNNATNNILNGIELVKSGISTIRENTANNNQYTGIQLFDSEDCTIRENVANHNNLSGIWLDSSSNSIVMKNNASGNCWIGIGLWNSSSCEILENNASYNVKVGIWLDISENCNITGNNANENNDSGIQLRDSANSNLTGNTANGNDLSGIWLESSDWSPVTGNIVNRNGWDGIGLWNSSSCNVTGNVVNRNSHVGIELIYSVNCVVSDNIATSNNHTGILLDYCFNSSVSANTANDNGERGIWLSYSGDANVNENEVSNNGWGGVGLRHSGNCILSDNNATNNGKYGIYLENCSSSTLIRNTAINNVMSGIRLHDSNSSIVSQNIALNNYLNGIILYRSSDSRISGNFVSANAKNGIKVEESHRCIVSENTARDNLMRGIWLFHSNSSGAIGNIVLNNSLYGIAIGESDSCIVARNNVSNGNYIGIRLWRSTDCNVLENIALSNIVGIEISGYSYGCNVTRNNLENNGHGVQCFNSSDNLIHHNNLVNNTYQVFCDEYSINNWDDGYPSGGNYWSDYTDIDLYSGPYQNETGSDGIWDHPYVIDENNRDRYPLMNAYQPVGFNVTKNGKTYTITAVSNSTITNFNFSYPLQKICFNVTGPSDTTGYCTVILSKDLINDTIVVLVDGNPIGYNMEENATHFFIFFMYSHSTSFIEILATILGDINGDRIVDIFDLVSVAIRYGAEKGKPPPPDAQPYEEFADINGDGIIDIFDIVIIGIHYGETW